MQSTLVATYSKDGTIKVFDIANWLEGKQGIKTLHSFEAHKSEILCCNFSVQMKKLIAGSKDNYISMWDLESGALVKFYQAHSCDVVMT